MKNREFKFRVWHPRALKWVEFNNGIQHDRLAINFDGRIYSGKFDDCMKQDEYVIQQFTGLKDKNGKDIYEGDIVKTNDSHIAITLFKATIYSKGEIMWIREGFSVGQKMIGSADLSDYVTCNCCPCGLEIIGNIFQNPELLSDPD